MNIQEVQSSEPGAIASPTVNVENLIEGSEQPTRREDNERQEGNGASDDGDDDDDVTIIILEQGMDNGDNPPLLWDQDSPEMEQRRRNVLLRELHRVQRASFIHFMILCLIPTSLLFIVIATVVGEEEDCDSAATTCTKEARTFINAFTSRCICDAITVTLGTFDP